MSLRTLYAFVMDLRRMSKEDFLASYPDPVLVIEPFKHLSDDQASDFETLSPGDGDSGATSTVGMLRKREGANAFAAMVTIGRAQSNDVRIDAGGISKVHAYFMQGLAGEHTLGDAGSTYGTYVRGEQVVKGARVSLKPRDPLRLGSVRAVYHTPESLYDYLLTIHDAPEGAKL